MFFVGRGRSTGIGKCILLWAGAGQVVLCVRCSGVLVLTSLRTSNGFLFVRILVRKLEFFGLRLLASTLTRPGPDVAKDK